MAGEIQIWTDVPGMASTDPRICTPGNEMYFVLGGKFEVFKTNSNGQKTILGHINAKELIGEMSFLDDLERSASVAAIEPSKVLLIPKSKFANVIKQQPGWFRGLLRPLSQRLRDTNSKLTDMTHGQAS